MPRRALALPRPAAVAARVVVVAAAAMAPRRKRARLAASDAAGGSAALRCARQRSLLGWAGCPRVALASRKRLQTRPKDQYIELATLKRAERRCGGAETATVARFGTVFDFPGTYVC